MEFFKMRFKEKLYGKFVESKEIEYISSWSINKNIIEIEKVKIEFLDVKNGIIKNLVLKEISSKSVLGIFEYGYYEDIRYCVDYFLGYIILRENFFK